MVYFHVFIMIRFIARCFIADITRERSRATMHFHMLRQIVASMERLAAFWNVAYKLFSHFVLSDVSLTVVLSDELAAAVVARVWADRFVRVHVRYVLGVSDEGAFAQ